MTELLNLKWKSFYGKFSKLAKKNFIPNYTTLQLFASKKHWHCLLFIQRDHYTFFHNYVHYKLQKTEWWSGLKTSSRARAWKLSNLGLLPRLGGEEERSLPWPPLMSDKNRLHFMLIKTAMLRIYFSGDMYACSRPLRKIPSIKPNQKSFLLNENIHECLTEILIFVISHLYT